MFDPNDSHYYSPQTQHHLSPEERTQAIARGRTELMEIVRNMPESTYELSLRDIVDKPPPPQPPPQTEEEEGRRGVSPVESKGSKRNKASRRKSSVSAGFLLKMVFLIGGFREKKNQKKNCSGNSSSNWAKVSPKPPPVAEGSVKAAERECWKKPSDGSEDARSSGSSCTGSSGLLPRCWAFFRRARGNKGAAVQG